MKDYTVLENGLEVAEYEDGVRFVGNFSDTDIQFGEHTVPAGDFIVI